MQNFSSELDGTNGTNKTNGTNGVLFELRAEKELTVHPIKRPTEVNHI